MRGRGGFGGRMRGAGPMRGGRPGRSLWRPGPMRPWGRRLGTLPLLHNGMYTLIMLTGMGFSLKLHQDDLCRIEEQTGRAVQQMSEEELLRAMRQLGIENQRLNAEERQTSGAVVAGKTTAADLEVLQQLTQMHYAGYLTEEEYQAKKKQILGI